ncbi:cytochrome c maturation protein CcmE [Anaerolineae bacterium CFX9]|nr:cytochrome c maturation protein CcmE [Anaerolineae bacterium CFX9]
MEVMSGKAWEKSAVSAAVRPSFNTQRIVYFVIGAIILAAVAYLLVSGTLLGARYFITVDDLMNSAERYTGQSVRVAGAVLGDTIFYDPEQLLIEFTVVQVQEPYNDLAEALHLAVNNPNATRLNVRVENQVKPELLVHEAQAIMTGVLGEDGIFHVSDLNLKCPTRFVENQPDQSIANPEV